MRKIYINIFMVLLSLCSEGLAQSVYVDDLTTMPGRRLSSNFNQNYAGIGTVGGLNYINQRQWLYLRNKGSFNHRSEAADIEINHNVYHLIDLSDPLMDTGGATQFFLSFDVLSFSGEVSLFGFAGGGLEYAGTSKGCVLFYTNGNPCTFQPKNGATGTQVIDGATTKISATGRFSVPITTSNVGQPGDYLLIAFANAGESLTIDNIKVELPVALPTLSVQVPNSVATEALGTSGTIRISRAGNLTGDLDVSYALSGSADGNDYAETHTGSVTIPDGIVSVDLQFTAIDDEVFEGYETVQLELTADASYELSDATNGAITISDVSFQSDTLMLAVEPDGAVNLQRDGELLSSRDSLGWSIFKWTDEEGLNTGVRTLLDVVTPISSNELQLASSDGSFQVRLAITPYERYFKFELLEVINDASEPFGLNDDWPGHRVEFDLQIDPQDDGLQLNTLPLNPMVELGTRSPFQIDGGSYFSWPYPQWAQTDDRPQPQGAVAVFGFTSDTEHDDILADVWVAEDSLPRPNRTSLSSWTKDDIWAWLDLWEADEGKPRRILSFSPKGDPDNLFTAADIAYAGGLNRIYLHNADWQGNSQGDANATHFPGGANDVIAWRKYCDARGMDIYLHGFGQMVQYDDPYYGRFVQHEGLARSAQGTLVNSVTVSDTTLLVDPDLDYHIGMKAGMLPHYTQPPWGTSNSGRGNSFPPYYESNSSCIRINGSLYKYTVKLTTNNQWEIELSNPLAGFQMAAHTAGDTVEFMVMGAGGWFAPDSRSALLVQLADEYAAILNHFQANPLYDGTGWTGTHGSWGVRKFSQMVYEKLDHPVGTGSSNGAGPFGNFEFRFKRVQNAMGSAATVPLRKWGDAALASSFDDIHNGLNYAAGAKDITVRGDHQGITVDIAETHGLSDDALAGIGLWSNLNPYLTNQQIAMIRDTQEDLFAASETVSQWLLTKSRAMRRSGIDGSWQRMTERPDIAPRQFLKADGAALSGLENPYAAQTPEVELHVMAEMSFNAVDNVSLMPTGADMIVNPLEPEQTLVYEDGKLIVSYDNSQSFNDYYHWDRNAPQVGHWSYESLSGATYLDMSESRGIAITVNVPDGQRVDGGVLAFATSGGFPRTYVVELDFEGERTFEIPHGEAANNAEFWTTYNKNPTSLISAHDYSRMDLFRIYITGLPARESTRVEVLNIEAMKEDRTTGLIDPIIALNSDSVSVNGTIPYNHYLTYSGGSTAEVCDADWNFVQNLPVTGAGLTAVNGANSFSVTSTSSPSAHLSSRIKVEDTEGSITIDKPVGFDSDNDGLADLEEGNYGSSYTRWDSDGDGFGDGYEVLHGFSPILFEDTPEFLVTSQIEHGTKTFTISFNAAFDDSYTIYSSDDLRSGWTPVETGILGAGVPVVRSYQLSVMGLQKFFRISRE